MEDTLKNKLKYLVNKKKTLLEFCETLELKDYEVIGLVELMKQDGELLDYVNGEVVKLRKPIENFGVYEVPDNTHHLSLLMISDSHLANKADRIDILNYLYDKAENKGIKYVLHCGDVLDGIYVNRPQHIYELRCVGFDEHLDYVINK